MTKHALFGWIAAAVVVSVTIVPTHAEFVTWEFAGHVTSVDDRVGLLGSAVTVGSPFSGSFRFDAGASDFKPMDPTLGLYSNIEKIEGTVGVLPFDGPIGPKSMIFSNYIPPTLNPSLVDGFGTNTGVTLLGRASDLFLSFYSRDANGLSTDALPADPPSLDVFSNAFFNLSDRTKGFFVQGVVTSLVPEPTSLSLLLVCLAAARRRRKKP